jgi:hypothetical protein
MRLTILDHVRPALVVLCLAVAACGSDDSGGKKNEQPGDGDNSGDGDNGGAMEDGGGRIPVPGDGDGDNDPGTDGGASQQCQDGASRACTCDDGTSQGSQLCIQGQYIPGCANCPCMAGETQACFCAGGGVGNAQCVDTKFGECVCEAAGSCPDGFMCQDLSNLGMGSGGACLAAGGQGGFGIPPMCEKVEDCAAAGLPDATCSELMNIPIKLCVQSCTPDQPQPDNDAGVGDAGA